jgi:hypothetical protein
MTISLGSVAAGATIYIPFGTYGKTNGESITASGFALADIKIYKDGSTTERASTAGYALLDTDGIDFDGLTGIHGFSVNLGDNTTSGFFAVGSRYWIVVGPITVDGQTINFVAAVFNIIDTAVTLNAAIADAILDRNMATGTDSGSPSVRTVRQALRFLRNKWSISGSTMTVTKEDDATSSWTAAVTGTAGADPITSVDPA